MLLFVFPVSSVLPACFPSVCGSNAAHFDNRNGMVTPINASPWNSLWSRTSKWMRSLRSSVGEEKADPGMRMWWSSSQSGFGLWV